MDEGRPNPPAGPKGRPGRRSARLEARAKEARLAIRRRAAEGQERIRERNEAVNRRSGRNLFGAIAVGVLLGAVVLASLVFVKQLFLLVGLGFAGFLVVELSTAMRQAGRQVPRAPSLAVVLLVLPAAYFLGPGAQWTALIAGVLVVSAWRVAEALLSRPRARGREVRRDLAAASFVQIYVTFLGSFTVMLVAQERGEWWAIGFLLITVCIDTGAYVFGLNFGRHKLAPRISPGKTWEGLGGALLTAVVVAVPVSLWLFHQPWWFAFVAGPLLVLTATAGDLTESMIKRDLGIKDMSDWLPGHGGFFDRVDSILPSGAMAFALYFWSAGLSAGVSVG
ncbi:MAG: phosphatidate cytidylyltransferase [Pseudoclavibacter sp.]|nr:phosphatidate cytidylyltransferase [Pseudoclavibacter sp.]